MILSPSRSATRPSTIDSAFGQPTLLGNRRLHGRCCRLPFSPNFCPSAPCFRVAGGIHSSACDLSFFRYSFPSSLWSPRPCRCCKIGQLRRFSGGSAASRFRLSVASRQVASIMLPRCSIGRGEGGGRDYDDDELVVNYHDAVVYGRDLRLLECSTTWLNDSCIHFHLTRIARRSDGARKAGVDMFADPSVLSFLVHQCDADDEMLDFVNGHDLFRGIARFFLPINDLMTSGDGSNAWRVPGKGTHWSLLVALVPSSSSEETTGTPLSGDLSPLKFFHLDSVSGSNSRAARAVARKWQEAWTLARSQERQSKAGETLSAETSGGSKRDGHQFSSEGVVPAPKIEECEVPQQKNGHDCGVYVLAFVEALTSVASQASPQEFEPTTKGSIKATVKGYFQKQNDQQACERLRRTIAKDIRSLAGAPNRSAKFSP